MPKHKLLQELKSTVESYGYKTRIRCAAELMIGEFGEQTDKELIGIMLLGNKHSFAEYERAVARVEESIINESIGA